MKWKKSEPDVLKPGDIFEKYTVEKLLGRGGMGAVYLVRHNILDSLFALKVLFPEVASKNRQFVDRFIREAKLACKIKHPNLIAVHDAGKNPENGMYYIIMDYASGGSVRDLLKRTGHISPIQAVQIIRQVAFALETARRHNMVHRDIKPDNIMFTSDGSAKLADLGIAKSTDEQDTMLTMEASVFGTPAYMSPEQAMDSSKVDCRADIYSLGIVFYEMLSGQRPYRGGSTIEILSQVVRDEDIPDIRTLNPGISRELAELLRAMCAKNIKKRIQTPIELLSRLDAITIIEPAVCPTKTIPIQENEITLPTIIHKRTANADGDKNDTGKSSEAVTIPTVTEASSSSSGEEQISRSDFPEITMPAMVCQEPPEQPEANEDSGELIRKEEKESSTLVKNTDATIPLANVRETAWNDYAEHFSPSEEEAPVGFDDSTGTLPEESPAARPAFPAKRHFISLKKMPNKLLAIAGCCILVLAISAGILFHMAGNGQKREEIFLPASEPVETLVKREKQPGISYPTTTQAEAEKQTSVVMSPSSLPDNSPFDPLKEDTVVLLGGATEQLVSLKKEFSNRDGKVALSFIEAENFSQYRKQLSNIIAHSPRFVILAPAGYYAAQRLSRANFDLLILEEANMLRDNGVPFAFLMEATANSNTIKAFNSSVRELCNLRSFTIIDATSNDSKKILMQLDEYIR
ncbi:serine/threonine protein kinase [bacterium]|nr:serine/threonine protein kinase [bacterium]